MTCNDEKRQFYERSFVYHELESEVKQFLKQILCKNLKLFQ